MIVSRFILSVLLSLLLFQLSAQHKIVVVGKAANYLDGPAVVSTKNGKAYFLKEQENWDAEIEGKIIKVWGTFKLKKEEPFIITPGYPVPKHYFGDRRLILKSRWRLVSKHAMIKAQQSFFAQWMPRQSRTKFGRGRRMEAKSPDEERLQAYSSRVCTTKPNSGQVD